MTWHGIKRNIFKKKKDARIKKRSAAKRRFSVNTCVETELGQPTGGSSI